MTLFVNLKCSGQKTIEMPAFRGDIGDMNWHMAQERNEELKVALLSGDMTKQSVEMLQELVNTAGSFLVRFDCRDQKSDR